MIAVCPKCNARYRVDTTRLPPEGAKLRCSKCSALFLVRVPVQGAAAATSAARPSGAASDGRPVQTAGAPQRPASLPLVLVADGAANRGKASADALTRLGLAAHLVHDGVEAMLAIQRMLPRVVVLDASLPRMNGLEICEIVKRNESLRSTRVVLVGAGTIPDHDAASDSYGPDEHLEPPDLPDGLVAILRAQGLVTQATPTARTLPSAPGAPVGRAATAPVPSRVGRFAAPPSPAVATPVAPASASPPADAAREEERERARRLARIAVSEMLLYQPEKFAQACRDGTLERALEVEIQEARALIRQRIGPEVRAEADFVLEELHRVARERGART